MDIAKPSTQKGVYFPDKVLFSLSRILCVFFQFTLFKKDAKYILAKYFDAVIDGL